MKFSALIAIVAGIAVKADSVNDCGDSDFINQSSGGSPLISDCQQITRNIAGGGSWTIPCALSAQRTYTTSGTCAIGAHCTAEDATVLRIGNQDTIDIINESIRRFSFDGKVGAKGSMRCQDDLGEMPFLEWGIYHT